MQGLTGAPRRGLGLAATALAAVALAVGVAGRGCGDEADSPAGAVRALAAAARAGDREAVLELLGPRTRAWLDQAAHRAGQLAGGNTRYTAIDLVGAARGAGGAGRLRLTVRDEQADRAVVEVVDELGTRTALETVRVGGRWRVELRDRMPTPEVEARR